MVKAILYRNDAAGDSEMVRDICKPMHHALCVRFVKKWIKDNPMNLQCSPMVTWEVCIVEEGTNILKNKYNAGSWADYNNIISPKQKS